jgi:hypothetical protein
MNTDDERAVVPYHASDYILAICKKASAFHPENKIRGETEKLDLAQSIRARPPLQIRTIGRFYFHIIDNLP